MSSPPSCPRPESAFIKEKRKANSYKQPAPLAENDGSRARSGGTLNLAGAMAGVGTVETETIKKLDQTSLSIAGFKMWLSDTTTDALGMELHERAGSILHTAHFENKLRIFSKQPASYLPDWIPDKDDIASSLKQLSFKPKYPIACINSMVGSCLTAEETTVSKWKGKRVVLSLIDLPEVVLNNGAGKVSGEAWKADLRDIIDEDGDGIEVEEIKAFIEQDPMLCKDELVLQCLRAAQKDGGNVLQHFEPVKEKLRLAAERTEALDGGIGDDVVRAQTDWAQHLSLVDGWKDYPGIRVRPEYDGHGISAISALSEVPLIKQAATLMGALLDPLMQFGYEPGKNLVAFPYDWRCAVSKLEERDQYFSKMMSGLEKLHASAGEKVVIAAHSMGCRVAHYFLLWVTESEHGQANGGKAWLDEHIHSFMPIAGPFLGASSGTEQFLQPGNCSGLAPAVVNYTDGFAMIRSWGSMPLLFGSGANLKATAASHYIYTRREGCLHIEVLRAKFTGVTDHDDTTVRLSVSGVGGGELIGSKRRGREPEYNDIFQFAWEEGAEKISGHSLTIRLIDDNFVGDRTLGKATIRFAPAGEGGIAPAEVVELTDATVVALMPAEWARLNGVRVGDGARLWLNVRWTPSDAPLPAAFDPGEGCAGCGGTADVGTSEKKRAALKAVGLTEVQPGGKHAYDPRTTEMMFALEDIGPSYRMWQECYARDRVFRMMAEGVAPQIKLCQPIYGKNMKTQMGMVFKRRTGVWKQGERTNYFAYDEDATVDHPGYVCKKGVIYEKPGACPQASDPAGTSFGKSFASGDMTVPYWSLRWPVTWAESDVNVNVVEVEGGTHRGILSMPAAQWAVLQHVAAVPDLTFHIEAITVNPEAKARSVLPSAEQVEAVAAPGRTAPEQLPEKADATSVFVQFSYGNVTKNSAAVPLAKADGSPGIFGEQGTKARVTYDPNTALGCTFSLMLTTGLAGMGKGTLYPGLRPTTISARALLDAGAKEESLDIVFADSGITLRCKVTGIQAKRGCLQCFKR